MSDLPISVVEDFIKLFKGDLLGTGSAREVYELATDPTKVLKIEIAKCSFQNANEWQIWQLVTGTKLEKYFAPCSMISPCGTVLIMAKTEPLRSKNIVMPDIITDLKIENFGMLKGKPVCHDYGISLHRMMYFATKRNKVRDIKFKKGDGYTR